MIEVRNLRVDYDDVCAVRDLSLDVNGGEVYGLIGPNGAGKTTTLRALVGLLEPTYGDVRIKGVDLEQHRDEATRYIGFMPDSAPLYDDLRVWEFLDLWAASYHIPADRRLRAIHTELERVDLLAKRDAMTGTLSRGMRQRLMLAKTLLPDPDILLLDEPASGVDPFGRALLKDILRERGAAGKAVIISSHILSELSEFCTSVAIMEKGSLMLSGKVEEVARRVFGGSAITLEVVSGAELVEGVLAEREQVMGLARTGSTFRFTFTGTPEEAGGLMAALVQAGVRMSSFAPEAEDLEAVFLKVGAREVS
jgi:ABC-2 type transport system ATP-binding protein